MIQPPSLSGLMPSFVRPDMMVSSRLAVETRGTGFTDITGLVADFLRLTGARDGAVTLFIRHTSASLTIQENADPSVLQDLATALARLAPENAGWVHDTEGPDDMPAHVKTMLTSVSLQIPVLEGSMVLGTWQGIFLWEHRDRGGPRRIVATIQGRPGEGRDGPADL